MSFFSLFLGFQGHRNFARSLPRTKEIVCCGCWFWRLFFASDATARKILPAPILAFWCCCVFIDWILYEHILLDCHTFPFFLKGFFLSFLSLSGMHGAGMMPWKEMGKKRRQISLSVKSLTKLVLISILLLIDETDQNLQCLFCYAMLCTWV